MVDAASEHTAFPRRSPRMAAAVSQVADDVVVAALTPEWLARYAEFAQRGAHGAAQHPVWLRAWSRSGSPDIVTVTVEANGTPVLMLPLEVARQGWFTVARFVGGRHANANFPVADVRWARAADAGWLKALTAAVCRARPDLDMLLLERMLPEQQGIANPLLLSGAAPSPNLALAVSLQGGSDALLERTADRRMAKKRRSQVRKFEQAGGFRRVEAKNLEEVDGLLSAFFAFKEQRFRQAGIADVFAEPETRAAFRAVFADALLAPEPAFVLNGLEVGGVLRAVTGESRSADRITCEFGGISEDEIAKHSPGEFLFHLNIEEACSQGKAFFDFGVGDEPYKRQWCDVETTHFDTAVPLGFKGHILTAVLGSSRRLKGAIKRNPALWQALKRLRRQAAGVSAAEN